MCNVHTYAEVCMVFANVFMHSYAYADLDIANAVSGDINSA